MRGIPVRRCASSLRPGHALVGLLLVGSFSPARVARADDAAASTEGDASPPVEAAAAIDEANAPPPWLTARVAVGVGGGNIGVSGKVSFAAEGWLGDYAGFGAFGGASGQSTVTLLGPSNNENDEDLGLALALRSSPGRHFVLFSVGGALARGHEWRTAGLSFDGDSSVPAPIDQQGTSLNLVLGWLADIRGFELGVVTELDVMSWGTSTFTVNLALGFGARPRVTHPPTDRVSLAAEK